jgi:dTDP-4-amino-4,6-dideoxygalactose transaminase
MNNIPFLDLVSPHKTLERELSEVFREALSTASFVGGPAVERFESSFAAFCSVEHAVAVNSGTDALRFALMACGVTSGDVVVTVSHTFIATVEAITQAGAIPEFVDIDSRTYNMDPKELERYLETQCDRHPRTGRPVSRRSGKSITAIIPVHLYGQMADMDPILDLAERYGLIVIEDACQAHGAEYFSKKAGCWLKAGSMGHAAAFSFYPGKNLGACGEAGAAITSNSEVAARIRMLRDHGQSQKYYHEIEGYNGRMDSIQAGILTTKLAYLDEWNSQRRAAASLYNALFKESGDEVAVPYEPSWSKAVYHLYVVRLDDRDNAIEHLKKEGIGTGIHYPVPIHMQRACIGLNYGPTAFPVTTRAAKEILSLPMYPGITRAQQVRVVEAISRLSEGKEVSVS